MLASLEDWSLEFFFFWSLEGIMCPCWLVHAPQLAPLSIVMVTCSPCCSRSSMASVTNIYSVAFAVRTIRTVFIGLFRNPIKVFQYELNEVTSVDWRVQIKKGCWWWGGGWIRDQNRAVRRGGGRECRGIRWGRSGGGPCVGPLFGGTFRVRGPL